MTKVDTYKNSSLELYPCHKASEPQKVTLLKKWPCWLEDSGSCNLKTHSFSKFCKQWGFLFLTWPLPEHYIYIITLSPWCQAPATWQEANLRYGFDSSQKIEFFWIKCLTTFFASLVTNCLLVTFITFVFNKIILGLLTLPPHCSTCLLINVIMSGSIYSRHVWKQVWNDIISVWKVYLNHIHAH